MRERANENVIDLGDFLSKRKPGEVTPIVSLGLDPEEVEKDRKETLRRKAADRSKIRKSGS
jgi:hypothetical protein